MERMEKRVGERAEESEREGGRERRYKRKERE